MSKPNDQRNCAAKQKQATKNLSRKRSPSTYEEKKKKILKAEKKAKG